MTEMAAPVLRDVRATAPFVVSVSRAPREAGIRPRRSICEAASLVVLVWEAHALLAGGDGILVAVGEVSGGADPSTDTVDIALQLATATSDFVNVELWQRGSDPTWPPCPIERTHIMVPRPRSTTRDRDGLVTDDSGATWTCSTCDEQVEFGRLRRVRSRFSPSGRASAGCGHTPHRC